MLSNVLRASGISALLLVGACTVQETPAGYATEYAAPAAATPDQWEALGMKPPPAGFTWKNCRRTHGFMDRSPTPIMEGCELVQVNPAGPSVARGFYPPAAPYYGAVPYGYGPVVGYGPGGYTSWNVRIGHGVRVHLSTAPWY